HNNFINNSWNAVDAGENMWDDGSEGNYWDDYTGIDIDGNGIGESPYIVGVTSIDYYPLMKPVVGVACRPIALFTYSPLEPTRIDTVLFEDSSYDLDGIIVNWSWNLGDGNISYEQNPSHKYAEKGVYTVDLTIIDNDGGNATISKQVTILNAPPRANFTFSPQIPTSLDIIQFTDCSVDLDGAVINWSWEFGDGNHSYKRNPTHKYGDSGTYIVVLKVIDNDYASHTISKQIAVLNIEPIANFTFSPESPTSLDIIQFTDCSGDLDGIIASWYWDFGDDNSSYEQNPSHRYADNGTYNVILTVRDNHGAEKSITKKITVLNVAPTADFTFLPLSPTAIDVIEFNSTLSYDLDGNIVSQLWNFGDGIKSTLENPTHKYSKRGSYIVNLTVWDNDGTNHTITKTIIILNSQPTLTNITLIPETGTPDTEFTFRITYSDADGDEPAYMRIVIDNVAYNMTKISGNYAAGAIYEYKIKLSAGKHEYKFGCDDGSDTLTCENATEIMSLEVSEKAEEGYPFYYKHAFPITLLGILLFLVVMVLITAVAFERKNKKKQRGSIIVLSSKMKSNADLSYERIKAPENSFRPYSSCLGIHDLMDKGGKSMRIKKSIVVLVSITMALGWILVAPSINNNFEKKTTSGKVLEDYTTELQYGDLVFGLKKDLIDVGIVSIDKGIFSTHKEELFIEVKVQPSECSLLRHNNYTYIEIDGFKLSSNPGIPQLPTKTIVAVLPKGAKVSDVNIVSGHYREIKNSLNIPLTPHPHAWGMGDKNEEHSRLSTGKPVSYNVGSDNKFTYVFVRLCPLQYLPNLGKGILITDASIKITYTLQGDFSNDVIKAPKTKTPILDECIIICTTDLESVSQTLADFH
ncbi:MAG: PKD domain-containing protein, partial [Candidatus Thermoplasmatota archaeon]